MTGADALLKALRGMGVERIFASPGSDWAPLWEALAKPWAPGEIPEYISVRHEETAVSMASGWSKSTGKLPAVMLHTTVGALHAAMTLRIAMHERVPMVVLAGEVIGFAEPPGPKMGRQWLRLLADTGGPARLVESCVKWSFALNTPALLPQTMQRACQLAVSGPRGPVFVSVPTEYLLQEMAGPALAPAALPRAAGGDPASLDELAHQLAAARRPLIITEEAGRDPAAVRSLVALAERLGAPVAEAWQPYYVNFPREHPLYAGVVTDDIDALVNDCDAVLLADCVLPWHPPSSLPRAGTKVFAIGEDPLRSQLPYWGFKTDLVVPGEIKSTLDRLLGRLPAAGPRERVFPKPTVLKAEAESPISTAWVAQELNAVLPEGAILVNETITHRLELLRRLTKLEPGGFYESSFGGLGTGLATALGVKHAHPRRTVICTIGDGAFHYNPVVASFGAAQELQLPMLVILFNNAGYLSQRTDVVMNYPQGAAARSGKFAGTSITPAPDYVKLAQAYGGWGEKVVQPGELRAALKRGLEQATQGRLALLDVVLKPIDA
jgi:acetolactate synthase I/II/III large subunit